MHANDVQITRVYSRKLDGTILDQTFPDEDMEIAVDCEAGETLFNLGPEFRLQVYLRDLLTQNEIVWDETKEADLGDDPEWPDLAITHEFTVPERSLTVGHIYNVLARLTVGKREPNVSFAESPMFVVVSGE